MRLRRNQSMFYKEFGKHPEEMTREDIYNMQYEMYKGNKELIDDLNKRYEGESFIRKP